VQALIGRIQYYYYSHPMARQESEAVMKSNEKDPDILHEEGADWYLDETWQGESKSSNKTSDKYNKIRCTFAGRSWDFVSMPTCVKSPSVVLCPCVSCPDAPPDKVFPIQLISVRVDEADDAILIFRWFYKKNDLPSTPPRDFGDDELALGSAIFETPAEFVRDAVLVSFSDFASKRIFKCCLSFDDNIKSREKRHRGKRTKKYCALRRIFPKLILSIAPPLPKQSSTAVKFVVSRAPPPLVLNARPPSLISSSLQQHQPPTSLNRIKFIPSKKKQQRRSPRNLDGSGHGINGSTTSEEEYQLHDEEDIQSSAS